MTTNPEIEHLVATNGWNKWEKVILYRLDEQDKALAAITTSVAQLSESVLLVKFKLGLISFITATATAAAITTAFNYFAP